MSSNIFQSIIFYVGIAITVLTAIPVLAQMRNHPKGLFVCFFAEMWERFSYYGMRALLIYYLTQHFLFTDDRANEQYASYTTLVYLLPLIGGLVADRWIGTRKAVVFGGLLLVLGHFGMAFEGTPNQQTLTYQGHTYDFVSHGREGERVVKLKLGDKTYDYAPSADGGLAIAGLPSGAPIPAVLPKGSFAMGVKKFTPWAENGFYLAVSLIIMGVGFLKPNISSIVGQLYKDKDPRRDSGFQLYYFGINLGSFWAAIACGYLGDRYGWGAGFGAAGIGMLAGLLMFVLGKSWLMGKGEAPDLEAIKAKVGGVISRENLIYILGIAGVFVIYFLVQKNQLVGWLLGGGSAAILAYVIFNMVSRFSKIENFRLALAMILTLAAVIFWSLFEQAGSSLSLFAERNTSLDILSGPITLNLLGKTVLLASQTQLAAMHPAPGALWIDMGITASNTQSFNPFFILIFAPVFAGLFTWLARRRIDPDPVKKFAFGLVNVGIGFLVLVYAARFADGAFKVPLVFLLVAYFFHTIGELALSPVGLSQQTKLSPTVIVSTMMAIWFLGSSGGQFLAGMIAKLASSETVGGVVLDAHASLETSLKTFNTIGWVGIGIGIVFFALSFVISKWSYGVNDSDEA